MANIYGYVNQDTRQILRDSNVVAVKTDVNVNVFTFVFDSAFNAVNLSTAAKRVYYIDKDGDTKEELLTDMTQNNDGDYEVPWTIPSTLTKSPIRLIFGLSLTETSGNTVTKRWTTANAVFKILDSVCDENANEAIPETDYDRLAALTSQVLGAANEVEETKNVIANISGSSPQFVSTLADRTDTTKPYVVTETNHLYYYSTADSEWVDAGQYGSYQLSTRIDEVGKAVESAAVGKAIGLIGSTWLSDVLFGVPVFKSADASVASPDAETINTVNYIVSRLYDDGDEFYTYENAAVPVVYAEHGGHGMAVINDEFAFCIVSSAFSAYQKSGTTWSAINSSAIADYFTNSAFTIYATVKLQ